MVLVVAVVLGMGAAAALVWPEQPVTDCLTHPDSVRRLAGPQDDRFEEDDIEAQTVINARRARWNGTERYVVLFEGESGICLSGGHVQGQWPKDTSWDEMHATGAVLADSSHPTVEDLRVDGYGDAIRFLEGADHFVVRRVHFSDIRDDCIENDWLQSGTLDDSLLDGCYNAFSSRTYDGQDGVDEDSRSVLIIRNSLIRLQPMQRPYEDEGRIPGTAGFFKWDPDGPRLILRGNVFRADQRANTVGLAIPRSKIAGCSDNVMVWLGRGPYPAKLPSCFEVTRDVRVWEAAEARWKRMH